jgi:NhaA family Na+:H+ antiporter
MLGFAGAVALNRMGVQRIAPYVIIGVIMWVFVLKSGVHATLAGVLIALTIPLKEKNGDKALLYKVEHALHPWVAYMILPIFAFANAGVSLAGLSISDLAQPLTLGIAAGLFVGKQIGVLAATWIGVKSGIAKLPEGINWLHLYGVACLTGIGFTMSLFVGSLAFGADETMNAVRLGVIFGSLLSGVLGYAVLRSMKATPATD